MASQSSSDSKDEHLNESWVEFSKLSAHVGEDLASCSQRSDLSVSPPTAPSLANSSVERLLFEAQKESSGPSSYINSRASSQESPKSPHSPSSELITNPGSRVVDDIEATNWVLNWSSRPEIVPPSDVASREASHAVPKRHRLSIRNTRLMRGILFVIENLPYLLVSHVCCFVLGAVSVVVYLKKSRRLPALHLSSVDS